MRYRALALLPCISTMQVHNYINYIKPGLNDTDIFNCTRYVGTIEKKLINFDFNLGKQGLDPRQEQHRPKLTGIT